MPILAKIAPFMATPEQFKKGLEFTETYYHRNGITLACEPGGFSSKPMQDAINAVYSDDATPFNHYFMADGKTLRRPQPNDREADRGEPRRSDLGRGPHRVPARNR